MMTQLAHGARVFGLTPEMVFGHTIVQSVFSHHNANCVITCGSNGKHSRASKHYSGNALDYRSRHLLESEKDIVLRDLKASLGKDYDAILEAQNTDNEHFHVEYDPKDPMK